MTDNNKTPSRPGRAPMQAWRIKHINGDMQRHNLLVLAQNRTGAQRMADAIYGEAVGGSAIRVLCSTSARL